MAVKRRVIWLDDESWNLLQQIAKDRGDTVSGVIRNFWSVAADPIHGATSLIRTMPQADRDAILRRLGTARR